MDSKALQKVSYGVYIVSAKLGEKYNGQIANTVFQVTADPAQIAVCINKNNFTHECISSSKSFSVSVLRQEAPMIFIGKFGFKSGRDIDKFKDTEYFLTQSGIPVVTQYCVASIEADLRMRLDSGTHTLFVGQISDSKILSDILPMTYDYYHQIKGGKSPKTAPTYIG